MYKEPMKFVFGFILFHFLTLVPFFEGMLSEMSSIREQCFSRHFLISENYIEGKCKNLGSYEGGSVFSAS